MQPGVGGFITDLMPGQALVLPGTILAGHLGDVAVRPLWARGGQLSCYAGKRFLICSSLRWELPGFPPARAVRPQNPIHQLGLDIDDHRMVPEFNKYLQDNAISHPGLSTSEGAGLLGAR